MIPHPGWLIAPLGWRVIGVEPDRLVAASLSGTVSFTHDGERWGGYGLDVHPTPDWTDLATRLLLCHLAGEDGEEEEVLQAIATRRHHRPVRRR